MAAIKKLHAEDQLPLIPGIVPGSVEIAQASHDAPTAMTNSQLGITDATKDTSDGTAFILRCRGEHRDLPVVVEPSALSSAAKKVPAVRDPQWKAKGWVLKKANMLTVDLPKAFDQEVSLRSTTGLC